MPRPFAAHPAPTTPRGDLPRPKRRYDFGAGGVIYMLVTMLVALGAFNSQNNLLYWTFGFALALLLVSGVISGMMLMGLRVEREWISPAVEQDIVRVRYQVRNINRWIPTFAITITEMGFEPPEMKRPWYKALWRTRPAAPTPKPPLTRPRTFVAHVGAGETLHVESRARATRRGAVEFAGFVINTSFPFGLMGKQIHVSRHAAIVVTPKPVSTDANHVSASSRTGRHGGNSRRAGLGEEFFALREYSHGDSPRDVAWRASARRGALLVRQFAAPSPQRIWIVLHLRTRPGSSADDEQAIRIAAGLVTQAEQRGVEYGLAVPLSRLIVHPRRGEGHLARVLTDLGLLDLGADDGRAASTAFPPQAAGGGSSSCIIVHSSQDLSRFVPPSLQFLDVPARAPAEQVEAPAVIASMQKGEMVAA